MVWSSEPETTLKTGEKAEFDGVLVPDLNYRNYKTFEAIVPELAKIEEIESKESGISPVLWFLVGALVGGLTFSSFK